MMPDSGKFRRACGWLLVVSCYAPLPRKGQPSAPHVGCAGRFSTMTLEIVTALTRDDLFSALRRKDILVPASRKCRTTAHTETYIFCHLLSTLAIADTLTFPLSVHQQDKPDAVIRVGNTAIGIEITEAIPQQFAHLCAVAQQKYPRGHWLPAIHPLWDAPTFTPAEMQALLEKCAPGKAGSDQAERESAKLSLRCIASGWIADQAESEWANYILKCIDDKVATLAKPDFSKYDQNWLSIYDNLPLPTICLSRALKILRPLLTNRWLCHPTFNTLFVEHNLTIIKITAHASTHFAVNDLWAVR